MVTLGPQYLDKSLEYNQIHFPLQDSHHDSIPLIENLSSHGFVSFQEDAFEFYDPIYDFIEESYLTSPYANKKP